MAIVMNMYPNLKICIYLDILTNYYEELFNVATEGM